MKGKVKSHSRTGDSRLAHIQARFALGLDRTCHYLPPVTAALIPADSALIRAGTRKDGRQFPPQFDFLSYAIHPLSPSSSSSHSHSHSSLPPLSFPLYYCLFGPRPRTRCTFSRYKSIASTFTFIHSQVPLDKSTCPLLLFQLSPSTTPTLSST